MRIGLFFGSFNPVHIGHLILAQSAIDMACLDQVWFVVSPGSPDKDYSKLLHEFDRYDLVFAAIRDNPSFRVSDVEFSLPRPSYTYLTLRKLREKYPEEQFQILMGADNLINFHKWDKWRLISQKCNIIVFDRHGYKKKSLNSTTFKRLNNKNLIFIEFDKVNISSSQLRKI